MFWYKKAADQGDMMAEYLLGMAYLKGDFVAQNKSLAAFWLEKAADQGDSHAQKALQILR